ncbi:class I SAM-dependent methyltransferase [Anaerosolibacter sp.]|uniref:class I SAM-dependent methyltransferase n=1 Tax=Anaerosolibacter sp. TaxID=1872527 RepID=UPI0039EEA4CF
MKTFDAIWEEIHQECEWGKYPSEEIIRFVARNYYKRNRNEVSILDVGCGTGAVSWFLAREGFSVFGFDGSETAIKKAKERMQLEAVEADLIVCDAANLPYADNAMDAAIDSAVIYANCISGIKAILKECYRVLKEGGKLFSTGLFQVGMTGYGTGEKLEENTYREITEGSLTHRGTVHFFERQEISDLWKEAGFKNIKIDALYRTDNNGQNEVRYFMVEAEK